MEAETAVESGLDVVVAMKSDEEEYAKTNSDSGVNNTYVNPAFVGEVKVITEVPSIIPSVAPQDVGNMVSSIHPDNTSDTNNETAKHVFGWCCITWNGLQIFNKPVVFLICLCLGGIAQGLVVSGIALSSLTSIEKQFGLKSTEVALFQTVYDTAYGIASLFIGFAGRSHKPRYLGWGLLIMVFGAVLASVPNFLIGEYTKGATRFDDYCNTNSTPITEAPGHIEKSYNYKLIFNLGFIILGLGATPLYTLGPAHIDEVTSRGLSSVYLGVFYASCAIGPALGFILAKPILEIWIVAGEKPPLSLADPNWVGAWWVGFLIGAGLLIIPILPMLGLPRLFPNTEELNAKKRQIQDTIPEDKSLRKGWPAIKALLRNPPFIFISLGIAAESLAIGGFSTFIPKYVETQFNITPSTSALYVGVMGIPSAAGGVLLGGYCVKRFQWDCKEILKKASMLSFLAALFSAFILVGCHSHNIERPASSKLINSTCNINCNCINTRYRPICTGNMSYYSPCHAGCTEEDRINNTYYNCSCFPPNVTEASSGICNSETCPLFPVFVIGIFLLVVFTFLNNVPLINATFRVVNEGQGAFAMGFQQIFVRFLGFIPSPVLYGTFIDRSCNLWAKDASVSFMKTTNCLEYDKETFRYHMFIIALATKFMAFAFMFTAYRLYKLPSSKKTVPEGSGVDNATFSREQSTVAREASTVSREHSTVAREHSTVSREQSTITSS